MAYQVQKYSPQAVAEMGGTTSSSSGAGFLAGLGNSVALLAIVGVVGFFALRPKKAKRK